MLFSFTFNPYIAIIGDIKDSRKIPDRKGVQETLAKALKEINRKYAKSIASKFTITLGDEFQGLLYDGQHVMDIQQEIEQKMYPVAIRFGIGIGEIFTDINHKLAIGADGPGYYMARKAIEYLKQNEKKKQSVEADIRIEIDGDGEIASDMVNTILSLMTAVKLSWRERQRQVIWEMLSSGDSQANVAEKLGIMQSSVQKSLVSGKYYTYKEALFRIKGVLAEIRREKT